MNRPFLAPEPGRKYGPEYYWRQIKRFGDAGFTVADLLQTTSDVGYTTVKLYVHQLRNVGAIVKIGTGRSRGNGAHAAIRYAVARPTLPAPAGRSWRDRTGLRGLVQQQLWTAMRTLPRFVISELAVIASTDEVRVPPQTASVYVGRLVAAGLVAVVQPARRSPRGDGRPGVYRLLPSANTGPHAPKVFGRSRIFDPNRQAFVGRPLGSDTRTGEVSA